MALINRKIMFCSLLLVMLVFFSSVNLQASFASARVHHRHYSSHSYNNYGTQTTTTTTTSATTSLSTSTPATTYASPSTSNSKNLAGPISKWNILFGASVDYSVTYNGQPTLRFNTGKCEVNDGWIAVKPGDHVVFKCWIKTNPSSGRGGIIGFDVYGTYGRLWEVSNEASGNDNNSFKSPKSWNYQYVPYGRDWTQMTIDITIPSTTFTHNDYGQSITPQQIRGLIPWLGPMNSISASIWFAGAELYINP